nr:immunoglobulin light chain junction region [Macaca mulatta]
DYYCQSYDSSLSKNVLF